jgi:hypothetical protein
MWATFPSSASSGYHADLNKVCCEDHTNPLNCRTSSSDISGYHASFHEGHGTVGECQGSDMTYVNAVWHGRERHGNGMSAERVRHECGMACVK